MGAMLMAFANLNPVYAIWRDMGLNFLFLPEGLPKEEQGAQQETKPPQRSITSLRGTESQPVQPPAQKAPPRLAWTPAPVEKWPMPWRERWSKAKKGLIGWTYWDLGHDLTGGLANGDKIKTDQRRAFLSRILKDLGHPAGTHTFWPVAMPGLPEYFASREAFWSGVSLLGCRGVVIMGSPAAQALLKRNKLQPLTSLRENGQLIWILRDIDYLAASEDYYATALTFLRNSLRIIVRQR